MEIALGIILLVLAVALVVLVLFQSGKDKNLSGAIAGGADTFFGKSKSADNGKILSTITAIISAVFAVVVLLMYFFL